MNLEETIRGTRSRLEALLGAASWEAETGQLQEALRAWAILIEELEVSAEELRVQQDELEHTRNQLDEERRRFEELFELAPVPYLVTDAVGLVREANEAAQQLLAAGRHLVTQRPLATYAAREDRKQLRRQLTALDRGQDEASWRLRVVSLDRDVTWVTAHVRRAEHGLLRWILAPFVEPVVVPEDDGLRTMRALAPRQLVDLEELVDEVVTLLEVDPSRIEADLAVREAWVDGVRVRRILATLVANSVRYAPEDSIVRIGAVARDSALEVFVEDEGPVIPANFREDVFLGPVKVLKAIVSPVHQIEADLPTVAEYAAWHGGRAWVEDTTDREGTSFRVLLPDSLGPAASSAS